MTFLVQRFEPPAFVRHAWKRGGHLQTLLAPRANLDTSVQIASQKHRVDLAGGDQVVLHDDEPVSWADQPRGSVLLLHGICGCHAADYMVRFANRLNGIGVRTFRLDMRGCGESIPLCRSITHAGRSEDVIAALAFIAEWTRPSSSPIGAVGVSLGGNQLLRAAGRVGGGLDDRPEFWDRVGPLLAIAPPIDLQACSDRMQAWSLRFYNRYFITRLIERAKSTVQMRDEFQGLLDGPRPRTLTEFDRCVTAPMAGFESERAYYASSSAIAVLDSIDVPTLIVSAADDPLVPADAFEQATRIASQSTRVLMMPTGGHHGFTQAGGTAWTDDLVVQFFGAAWG